MIQGVHAMFYSSKADELRTFIKDKLKLPYSDVGDGWLIFDFPEGDLGVHPTEGDPPSGTPHVSFYCDDLGKTMAELSKRGVVFDGGIEDHGYGLVTFFTMPGNVKVQLYEPRYTKKKAAPASRKAAKPAKKPARKAAPASRKVAKPAKRPARKVAKKAAPVGKRPAAKKKR